MKFLPTGLVLALAVGWTAFVGSLAVARYDNLRTNAFDLGYISQTLWNTGRGEPFRLTVLEGATFRPEGLDPSRLRRPHSYLAFHVEPIDLPLAAIYGVWPDPRMLLWLQATVLGLGALPAAWLGRRMVGGPAGTVAFGAAWLLAPGLEGAALSDFHAVALGATALMAALWLWESGQRRWSWAAFMLAAATREDAALAVASVGAVLWLRGERRGGLAVLTPALTWALLCFGLIAPYFNGGGNLFAFRYAWLKAPGAVAEWLTSTDVGAFYLLQLLAGGLILIFAPLEMGAAWPLLAVDGLSSFDWMRSGGAHYAALLVPLLLWAGAHGARRIGRPWLASAVVLMGALAAHAWIGASPLRPGFVWPDADPRAAVVLAELDRIPADAAVSASSALYPHLSNRHRLYWFPAVENADWIAVDVAGTTAPLSAAETRSSLTTLLGGDEWGVVGARDGVLILRRGAPTTAIPEAFLGFARTGPAGGTALLTFGPSLELVDARLHRWPQVGLFGDAGVLETRWRTNAAILEPLTFVLATTRSSDRALSGYQADLAATPLWYPTTSWQPGEVVQLDIPIDRLGGLEAVGVAVLDQRGESLSVSGPPGAVTWEAGTIGRVAILR